MTETDPFDERAVKAQRELGREMMMYLRRKRQERGQVGWAPMPPSGSPVWIVVIEHPVIGRNLQFNSPDEESARDVLEWLRKEHPEWNIRSPSRKKLAELGWLDWFDRISGR